MAPALEDCAVEGIAMSTIMSTENLSRRLSMEWTTRTKRFLALTAFALFAGPLAAQSTNAGDSTNDGSRKSITLHHVTGGRDNPRVTRETTEDYAALVTSGSRASSKTRGGQSKIGGVSTSTATSNLDFWFYNTDVQLFNDDDNDGYYHGIDLLFDVDTNFIEADVFAVMYLSLDGGPWNEYAATEDFTIFGASSDDEYVLVSELMSGYPTGSYDILIELFDAFDGAYLTEFGPEDTSALAFLPLEDFDRDAPLDEIVVFGSGGGGGAVGGWFIGAMFLLLLANAVRKIWTHRNDALVRIDTPRSNRHSAI